MQNTHFYEKTNKQLIDAISTNNKPNIEFPKFESNPCPKNINTANEIKG